MEKNHQKSLGKIWKHGKNTSFFLLADGAPGALGSIESWGEQDGEHFLCSGAPKIVSSVHLIIEKNQEKTQENHYFPSI